MKRVLKCCVLLFSLLLFLSCASTSRETKDNKETFNKETLTFTDISGGLPSEGLWRQNIALADMSGGGFLDIVAPPPRKAEADKLHPFIFSWSPGKGKWTEGSFRFPEISDYSYAGIAVGDINRDGAPDIVLANHTGRIILLLNNKQGAFVESAFPMKEDFSSRTVEIADVNGDGWPDVIAFSEGPFHSRYKPQGILVGINKEGKGWEVKVVEGGTDVYGDSMAVGDLKGNGLKDVVVAPETMIQMFKKSIWFGDGKSNFNSYEVNPFPEKVTIAVRAGDADGDGKDVAVFRLSSADSKGTVKQSLAALKWTGEGFADISEGLEAIEYPYVFDFADLYGDGKKQLVVLSDSGIGLYRHGPGGWVNIGFQRLSPDDTRGTYSLRAGRNRDGSLLIVYNQGTGYAELKKGIRAFKVTLSGGK
ncbi:MAG TPA: VCBS repeat-containing protein [Thermodesulfovibrionales bacterium]|nr:VCBS repeat-containing protein [Thermodesulfovibrionales bacterium]